MDDDPNQSVATYILSNINQFMNDWDNLLFKKLVDKAAKQHAANGSIDIETFKTSGAEEERNLVIDFMSSPYEYADWEERGIQFNNQKSPETNHTKDAKHATFRFLLKKIERRRADVSKLIEETKSDPEKEELLLKYLRVLKMLNERRQGIADVFGTTLLW